ncbi:KR-domain-containing protein [Periconia macrospinosa]|uniref:KR-domain-containing protein n=1 Tax=Periconia macrospinosa TaxID=97972 RepID=A0A2V1DME7_9PLEO|nr:KR-domain-containing protein [Periconia macrospinosa]
MGSDFLSWDACPSVPSTIKRWNDDEFLSWDKPLSVEKRQDDTENISKANVKGREASTPKSAATRRSKAVGSNESAGRNSQELKDINPAHELLGSRVASDHSTGTSWINHLETKKVPWISEVVFFDRISFPFGAYISMVLEAARAMSEGKSSSYTLKDISFISALVLESNSKLQLKTVLKPVEDVAEQGHWYDFSIESSLDGSDWKKRCVGKISTVVEGNLQFSQAPHPTNQLARYVSKNYWYDITADSGLQYGPQFQILDEITTSVNDLQAIASSSTLKDTTTYVFHPVTLELVVLTLMIARYQGQGRNLRKLSVPSYIEKLVFTGASRKLKLGAQITKVGEDDFTGDISIISDDGHSVLAAQGCRMSAVSSNKQKLESKLFSTTKWSTAKLKAGDSRASKVTLLVPNNNHSFVTAVQKHFQKNGVECETCTFEDSFSPGQDVISLLDFVDPYVYNFTEARFQNFTKKLSAFKGSLIWVTPSAQVTCKDPNTSMIIGLARTIRVELRKDITTVEVDTEDSGAPGGVLQIYRGLGGRPKSKDQDPDYEYAIVDGEVKIPRLHWTTMEDVLASYDNGTSAVAINFRPDVCYFLVGGLGGLGREISRWMVENGAREILYLSRSAKEGPDTTPFFDELRSQGCLISTFAGSVNSLEDVEAAIKRATKPIAGVMQMSAVMRDSFLSQMTFSDWETSVQPKVKGQWGQANYNSANSFLDAFVKYRHGQNLAASVIDIGFMGGVGMATENAALVKNLKKSGYYFLSEPDLIDALAISILHSHPGDQKSHFALGITTTKPITASSCRPAWKKDARMSAAHEFIPPQAPTAKEVEALLNDALGNLSN